LINCLIDAVTNPDIAESFTILRNTGVFAAGGYQTTPTTIQVYGTVGMAGQEDQEMIPEADRIHEALLFHSTTNMFLTGETRRNGTSGTADQILWRGTKFRCVARRPYPNRGYYAVIAVRMLGQ
jgi:hypothetical protein